MLYSCNHNSGRSTFFHIFAFLAFLCVPFITINHAMHILTKDTKTFASVVVKTWIKGP
jgi:hypothetical protein